MNRLSFWPGVSSKTPDRRLRPSARALKYKEHCSKCSQEFSTWSFDDVTRFYIFKYTMKVCRNGIRLFFITHDAPTYIEKNNPELFEFSKPYQHMLE